MFFNGNLKKVLIEKIYRDSFRKSVIPKLPRIATIIELWEKNE